MVRKYYNPGQVNGVEVHNNYVFLANLQQDLERFTIINNNLVKISSYDDPSRIYDVVLSDNYAYLAAGSCLEIIDIYNPYNPVKVGYSSEDFFGSA